MEPRVHGRELLDPDVLEYSEHRDLARLVDQRIVGDDREVDVHFGFRISTEARVCSQAKVMSEPSPASPLCGVAVIPKCSIRAVDCCTSIGTRAKSESAE